METKFIMISSSKGGVGKSTVALGISKQLAQRGESVLLCDLDFGNACQDILLGVEDRVIYTVSDVAKGKCRANDALVSDLETGTSGLMLLPCPAGAARCPADGGAAACRRRDIRFRSPARAASSGPAAPRCRP